MPGGIHAAGGIHGHSAERRFSGFSFWYRYIDRPRIDLASDMRQVAMFENLKRFLWTRANANVVDPAT